MRRHPGWWKPAHVELTAGIGVDEYAMAISVLERMSRNAERLGAGK